jgi:ribosomal protein L7/L12
MADVSWDALAPRLAALVERLDHIENYLTELGRVTGHSYGRYTSGVSAVVMELAMAGKTLAAIKQYRDETGASLDQARAAVARVTAGGV